MKVIIMSCKFSVENKMLTNTHKLRRKEIKEFFKNELKALYIECEA
jgi:long-subunit acyl-CoA synthetase (AMP-forming)